MDLRADADLDVVVDVGRRRILDVDAGDQVALEDAPLQHATCFGEVRQRVDADRLFFIVEHDGAHAVSLRDDSFDDVSEVVQR